MRTRSTSTATALAVLFSSAALAVGTAGSAAADSAKTLAVQSVGDIVVDGNHQRIYVSDPTSGEIVVTDYAGTVAATLTGLPGVTGLAVSADYSEVYAAVSGDDRIISVDTQTYTPAQNYELGDGIAPDNLEIVDGRLWFGYAGGLGSLDVSDPEAVVKLDEDGTTVGADPLLAADPAVPGVLAAGGGSGLEVFDVSADGAVLRTSGTISGSVRQIDLTPDGKQVLTSWDGDGFGYGIGAYSTTDLTHVGSYSTDAYPIAVAVASDGTIAGGTDSYYDNDIHIFKAGGTTPTREYGLPDSSSGPDTLVSGALAWAPDRSQLFAVSRNPSGTYSLRTLTDPTKAVPTLTVSAPASATRAKPLTITGKLSATIPVPAGASLQVIRTDIDHPKGFVLGNVAVKADGTFSYTNSPPDGGTVTYRFVYAGDDSHTSVGTSKNIAVSRTATALTLNNNHKIYNYGTDVTFTAHLGSTYKNRTVEIWSDPYGSDKPNKLVKTGTVNSSGNIAVKVDMSRDTTIAAIFKGDAVYAPKTVRVTAYAKVSISTVVSKHYKTGKIGSLSYYWFHKNTSPVITTTIPYYPGRKQRFDFQVYYEGSWQSVDSEYFSLGTAGKSAITVGAPGESGIKARTRSSYIDTSSGDNVNTTTYGSWKYLYFSN